MDNQLLLKSQITLDELRASNRIIYSVISGSHAYGTNTPESDQDLRGYFWVPPHDYISLYDVQPQVDDEAHDICYYSLKRAFDLLKTANPNQIELLWIPQDCIQIARSPIMDEILANRHLFISKKTYTTHASYAAMQIKKAKGKNKKVHNPQPETMPRKEDFCWVIDMDRGFNLSLIWKQLVWDSKLTTVDTDSSFPFRPVPLKESGLNLSHFHVSSLEHVPNAYRMYYYGNDAKGVFRGDQMLCCESISMDDELDRFRGLLIYNKEEYEKAVKDWHSYWDWVKNRNDSRWIDQEKGLVDFDAKNMMHCARLMMSCEHIFTHGEPLVRFEGEPLEFLRKIRRGEISYEKIMEFVEAKDATLKELYEKSTVIPQEVDMEKLDMFYKYLVGVGIATMGE
jgi:hypothetical protein